MYLVPAYVFGFLSVGAIALFGFLAVASWAGARQQERESYYKNDMLKKLADSDTQGATATLAYLQEKERAAEAKSMANKREGYLLGGLVNIGVGVALIIFLSQITHNRAVGMVGLIPAFVGIALLLSAFLVLPRKAA